MTSYTMPMEDVTQLVKANAQLARERNEARAEAELRLMENEALETRLQRAEREADALFAMLNEANRMAGVARANLVSDVARANTLRRERFGS